MRRKTKGKPRGASFQPGAEASALGRLGARRRWGYCDHCNAYQPRARGHRWAKMTHESHCPIALAEAAELAAEQARQEQERQAAEARQREAREAEAQRWAEARARQEQAEAARAVERAERERRTHEPRCQCAPCRAHRLATL